MNTYKDMKAALIKLCENEGLRFIEARLTDRQLYAVRRGNVIILNRLQKENSPRGMKYGGENSKKTLFTDYLYSTSNR